MIEKILATKVPKMGNTKKTTIRNFVTKERFSLCGDFGTGTTNCVRGLGIGI